MKIRGRNIFDVGGFSWFGSEARLDAPLAIGIAFVGVSLARGYLLRRLFVRLGKGLPGGDT
jgi:hypothetical protein